MKGFVAQWLYQDPPFPPSGHLAMSENWPVSGKEIKIAYFYINCFSYEFPSNSADLLCSKRGSPASNSWWCIILSHCRNICGTISRVCVHILNMKGLKQFICLGARGRELPEADQRVFGWFGVFWLVGWGFFKGDLVPGLFRSVLNCAQLTQFQVSSTVKTAHFRFLASRLTQIYSDLMSD